jgi:hypothetical protein
MTQPIRELYRSANGDRWSLIRDDDKVQVLHEPSAASGGRPSRLEVGDFLVRDAHGPRRAAASVAAEYLGIEKSDLTGTNEEATYTVLAEQRGWNRLKVT